MKYLDFFALPSTRSPLFVTAIKASLLTATFLVLGIVNDNLVQMSAMSMGVSAAALTDHPAQYHRRISAFVTLILCFGCAAISVVALYNQPWLFLIGLGAATFCLMMASALGPRFGKMSFGALAISVFSMLSYPHHPEPWLLPGLIVGGSVCYFILSTLVQYFIPNFNIEHDNQQLFSTLAKYQLLKARFFDSNSDPSEIRLRLAKLGAQASHALADMQQQLILRQQEQKGANHGAGYLDQFFKAQVLLERLSSSHIVYRELRLELADTSLPERIQRVMVGLSKRMLRQPRFRRIANYEMNDNVENELKELEQSTQRLAKREVFSKSCALQLGFLLENLNKVCELTQTHTAFPSQHFLFTEQQRLGWHHYWTLFRTPNTPLFRHAARLTTCMLIGYLIILMLPEDSQNYWFLLTILFITKPSFSATKLRLSQRIIGTVLGIALATGLYLLHLPVLVLIAIAAIAKFFFFWYLQKRYSLAVACVSIYVVIILQFYGLDAETLFIKRILVTTCAAGITFLALSYLWPDWLWTRSRSVVATNINHISEYQQAVFKQYLSQQRIEDEAYRTARFQAHLSEANLVEHWQALLVEPSSKRSEAATLYLLTGQLHAYLSHLSALASHRGRITSEAVLPLIDEIGEKLTEQLSELVLYLSEQESTFRDSSHQQVSDKLAALSLSLYGDDLMVIFQLIRLNEDIGQIRKLVLSAGDWQKAQAS
jgi:YccS/YhfK family integral membrane protein